MPSPLLFLFPLTLLPLTQAHDNGMDMSMDGAMSLDAGGGMVPYLHFTPGDTLFFQGWVPRSPGAIFGACIGLFVLAVLERWVGAVRRVGEGVWAKRGVDGFGWGRAQIALSNKLTSDAAKDKAKDKGGHAGQRGMVGMVGSIPPFIPSQDILRGVLHAVQVALGFLFMLAVMTFQAAFFISIVLGAGVGEMLFGRYAAGAVGGGMGH
ncbi:Ctr copper transporter family-domain-containing protein [Cyathus striatus]|nr:Ctr copper transporter family-domain-containing protein [Cyathus striatus]